MTEVFPQQSLAVFKQKYYPYAQFNGYLIKFEPTLHVNNFAA